VNDPGESFVADTDQISGCIGLPFLVYRLGIHNLKNVVAQPKPISTAKSINGFRAPLSLIFVQQVRVVVSHLGEGFFPGLVSLGINDF
jgi:hypothetical protein